MEIPGHYPRVVSELASGRFGASSIMPGLTQPRTQRLAPGSILPKGSSPESLIDEVHKPMDKSSELIRGIEHGHRRTTIRRSPRPGRGAIKDLDIIQGFISQARI
jgi:hypothetical protein